MDICQDLVFFNQEAFWLCGVLNFRTSMFWFHYINSLLRLGFCNPIDTKTKYFVIFNFFTFLWLKETHLSLKLLCFPNFWFYLLTSSVAAREEGGLECAFLGRSLVFFIFRCHFFDLFLSLWLVEVTPNVFIFTTWTFSVRTESSKVATALPCNWLDSFFIHLRRKRAFLDLLALSHFFHLFNCLRLLLGWPAF